ncbi:unnamed protein product [Arctogadus glacialis]
MDQVGPDPYWLLWDMQTGVLLALLDPGPETSWPVSVCLPGRLSQLGWESGLEPTEIRIYDFSRGFQKRTTTLTQN